MKRTYTLDIRERDLDLDGVLKVMQAEYQTMLEYPDELVISAEQEQRYLAEGKKYYDDLPLPDSLDGGSLWGATVSVQ